MNETEKFEGSCHCGDIAFEVEGEPVQAIECNCSICQRKGIKMWFVPESDFQLLSPEENLASYSFNTHRIHHHFCPNCGIHPFGRGNDKNGNAVVFVNLRCLENFDIEALPVHHFDGSKL